MIEARWSMNQDGLGECHDCRMEIGENPDCANCVLYAASHCPECHQFVMDHPAGACLDAWVQAAIFPQDKPLSAGHRYAYSAQMAAAWRVAMEMRARGWLVNVGIIPDSVLWRVPDETGTPISEHMATCSMLFMDMEGPEPWRSRSRLHSPTKVFSSSAELAISRCALAADAVLRFAKAHKES